MIKVERLNKYYNKRRQNQIHAIANTTLTFPQKGLVALTGPSGCGKTTLLNVIGGLDKFDSGTIFFEGKALRGYNPKEWDALRNASIGYIFQNYYLIEDKTVYENIEVALNMAGLYHHDQVEERINYVLKSVGMYNYRHRNAMALSGGQQQRVAIARAIAKNPGVVLADEPTGNLDVNNTFEIMNIIKKISETRLVILVSHERDLVDFYADRVIEILDGQVVKDYENLGNRTLEHIDERNIYLQDLSLNQSTGLADVQYYFDQPGLIPTVKLIHINNTLYVKVEGAAKVKYLSEDSEIRLLDAHYKKPETDDVSQFLFDLNQFGEIKREKRQRTFIRWRDTFKNGFKKFLNSRKIVGRFFLVVCFVVACLLAFNLARVSALLQEKNYMTVGRDFVQLEIGADMDHEEMLGLIDETALDSIVLFNANYSQYIFEYENYYQGSGDTAASMSFNQYISGFSPVPVSVNQADTSTIVSGRLPETNEEAAIDVWLADKLLANSAFLAMGIDTYEDIIGVTVSGGQNQPELQVVGVIETNSPVIVLTEANRSFFLSTAVLSAGVADGKYLITEGRDLENDDEVLLGENSATLYDLGDSVTFYEMTFTLVGFFSSESSLGPIISDSMYETAIVNESLKDGWEQNQYNDYYKSYLYFFADDPTLAVSQLTALGYIAMDSTQYLRDQNLGSVFQQMIYVIVGMVAVLVYIIFMMRSSMLSRIKEIGIYRSIGATKGDIYKIFFSEILAFTCLGSLTGYLFMTYVMNYVQTALEGVGQLFGGLSTVFYFPPTVFAAGLLGILLLNVFFGMLPIFTLLRKTPSEINTKYDI